VSTNLLFDSATWVVWLAPFAGILAAGLTKRQDPRIEGDRVLRHDGAAIIEHWTHGIATGVLLISGIVLGVLFIPALVGPGAPVFAAMNIHFVAASVFLFGTFYYGANTMLALNRLKEHLPTSDAVEYTKRHYGLLLGFKKFTMPPERKYFESEKMAYLLAAAATITIILTGFMKVLAHSLDLPAQMMSIVTPAHDVATVVMVAFFVPHIFFAAVLPSSWPILRSMFTGHVSLEYAKHEHAGWLAEIEKDRVAGESQQDDSEDDQVIASKRVA
jgi:formate dehydrogenase subunit gamma